MKASWAIKRSQGSTSRLRRACLQSLRARVASSQHPWPLCTEPYTQPGRRDFSSRCASLHASTGTQAAAESDDASASNSPGNVQTPARPRFGGLAENRQNNGQSPEDLERSRFLAARQAAEAREPKLQQASRQPRPQSASTDKNATSPRKFTITRLGSSRNAEPVRPRNFGNSDTRQTYGQPSKSVDSALPLPQRTRQLRQEGAPAGASSVSAASGDWGSLKRRDRTPGSSFGRSNDEARFSNNGTNSAATRQPIADDPYYRQANEREERTRSGRYVGLKAGSEGLEQSSDDNPRSTHGRQRTPSRFADDYTPMDDIDQRRDRRTSDATPRSRTKKAGRRAEKFQDDEGDEILAKLQLSSKADKKQKKREREVQGPTPIELPPFISVQGLAIALKVRPNELVEKLEELGFEDVAMDHVLDAENAGLVAMEYNFESIIDRSQDEDIFAAPVPANTSSLPPRPPVITIMGHVDHGKTTILDYLRKSAIAASEHGGITQHIGAFVVPMASGKLVTFLDTPGHAAFLSMRERGANVTDIVILVVAADDSVKPQTIEAIKHAKAAKVPIIVAINKVDKDQADVLRVKQDLMVHEIEVEEFGGDYQAIEVSGKTGQGMNNLEEAMLTQAEILDMRAAADGPAEGWIIEASTKKSGRTATVLVRRGTLRIGDVIVAGLTWARVRNLRNEHGEDVLEAGPGTPVEVDGWRDQPVAGDEVLEAETEQRATSVVRFREDRMERSQAATDMQAINDARRLEAEKRAAIKAAEGAATDVSEVPAVQAKKEHTDLYVIVRADVSGSTEAVSETIKAIPLDNQPCKLHILRAEVGPVSEFDLNQLKAVPAGEGLLVSFNQRVAPHIALEAERAGLKILDENIIYKVVDNVRSFVEDHLPPVVTPRVLGDIEIAQVFEIKVKRATHKVAGCRVRNGTVLHNKRVRVYRGGISEGNLVHDGRLSSLKNQKRDVQEMKKGSECGLSFEDWEDFEVGDIVQCYEEKSEKRRLV